VDDAEIERLLGGAPRVTLEGIIKHPRLPDARKHYIDRFLEVYGGDPFLVRLLIESGRFFVYQIVALLEASYDPARRETWPTVGLLKQVIAGIGVGSGRHIDHLVARMCAVGFMELKPAEQDRRVRILKPTEALRAHDRDWLAAHHAPLTVLFPEHDYSLVMRRDPAFQVLQRRTSVAFMPLGIRMLRLAEPDMMLFLNRAGGYMVIAALLQAAMAQPDQAHAAIPYADIGDRFGLSRTHVRKLLVAAQEAGLVKLHARGGHRVEILPRLWASHDLSISGGMYLHAIVYQATTRQQLPDRSERMLQSASAD
jgi:hypothetical protein